VPAVKTSAHNQTGQATQSWFAKCNTENTIRNNRLNAIEFKSVADVAREPISRKVHRKAYRTPSFPMVSSTTWPLQTCPLETRELDSHQQRWREESTTSTQEKVLSNLPAHCWTHVHWLLWVRCTGLAKQDEAAVKLVKRSITNNSSWHSSKSANSLSITTRQWNHQRLT